MSHKVTVTELTALLIEPSDVQRRIMTRSLQDAGLSRLESTNSIGEARHIIDRLLPDLIISAMYLPDGTAEDLLLELRNNQDTAEQAFMLVSSVHDRQRLETLRQSGVTAILPKPFSPADLDRALRSSVDILSAEELELEYFDITSLRILLVDDSYLARNYIRRVFESIGAEHFVEASNGREALELLRNSAIDMVVTDYNMPEMDGYELISHIRENAALVHLPILMISATDDEASLSAVTQAGVDAICDKPFDPETARATLYRLLGE